MPFNIGERLSWRSAPTLASSDDDSLSTSGPESIPYYVNTIVMPGTPGAEAAASSTGRASSLERRNQRSGGLKEAQPTLADVLNAVNALRDDNARTLNEISATNGRVGAVEDRLTKVETATQELEVKLDAVDLEIDSKIIEKVDEKVDSLVTEKFAEKLNAQIAEKVQVEVEKAVNERMKELAGPSSYQQVQPRQAFRLKPAPAMKNLQKILPKPKDKVEKRVQIAFQDLLASAEGRKRTFVVGMKDDVDTSGKRILPEVPFTEIFKRFFSGIRYQQEEPTTALSNKLPLIRFVVHPSDVHQAKMIIRDRGREIRLLGWWAAQESPKDLRDMEANAVKFFIEAKNTCKDLKRVWLQAEDGFVKAASVPILPVFSIPKDKSKWPLLAPILLQMVENIRDQDWLSRQKNPKSVDSKLYELWGNIVDPQQASPDSDSKSSDEGSSSGDDEESDSESGKTDSKKIVGARVAEARAAVPAYATLDARDAEARAARGATRTAEVSAVENQDKEGMNDLGV